MTDTATTAQALLALYGALDRAVTAPGGADAEATVERYLPGSTGANAGWYDELLGFLDHLEPRFTTPPDVPDLDQALLVLQARTDETADEEPGLTPVQLSRLVYAIGALSHLPDDYPPQVWDERFAGPLRLAGAPEGGDLLELLRRDFDRRDDWPQVMRAAVQGGLIDHEAAIVPLCDVRFKMVRGHPCVVLTTDFTSPRLSLDEVKNVIDPLNWHKCLPYFCAMDKRDPRPDGWSRVLEHFSTTCSIPGTPRMLTLLRYWKGQQPADHTAWVDYQLDDHPLPDGDGRMVVDEGFIRMTSTAGDATRAGVRVRTRKVVGFANLAYLPAAIFACVLGYADQGVTMVFGGAAKRPAGGGPDWTDWRPSTLPAGSAHAATAPEQPTPGQSTPTERPDTTHRAVALAVEMITERIDELTPRTAAIAEKWAAGAVPVDETVAFAADVATRLVTDPWRYLERLRTAGQGEQP